MPDHTYLFGPFELDPEKRTLVRRGLDVPLGPKVVQTLAVLVEHPGTLVTKAELMERLWPDRVVEEANLSQNIYRLRRVLSSAGLGNAIETMNCRGYRFVIPVERVERVAALRPALATRVVRQRRWVVGALAVAGCALLLVLGAAGSRPASAYARLSPESQRLYSVGRYEWNLRSNESHVRDSMPYFQGVIDRDPSNPLGYSGMADAYLTLFDLDCDSTIADCRRVVSLGTFYARRAVEVDPASAEAHTSFAMAIYEFTNQDAQAEGEFQRAIALDPNYALAHHWYGNSLLVRGLIAQANAQQEEAIALEPVSPATYAWLAEDAYFAHDYRAAVGYARQSLAIYPDRHATVDLLGLAYEQLGDSRAAVATFSRLPRVEREALTAALFAKTGDRARALLTLRAIDRKAAFGSGCTIEIALAWAALGDKDRAYTFLRATPPPNRVEHNFYAFDPRLDVLRSDSRFKSWTRPE
ncbi:MAG TPA: winged helix-turn-helix domain-containing protein [Candidatus Eremiobacteraceae bacterium]|jgi:DNA-binding winged helix-turn-helix (wHTH) protein/tetratricopeptide (TPR) repeat protein